MKKLGLLLFTLFLFVACGGGDGSSAPARDGKGNIDTVDYLPSKSMIKHFNYGWGFPLNIGGTGRREVNVANNKIDITQYTHPISPFMSVDIAQNNKSIIYDDLNIQGFFQDSSGNFFGSNNVTYRHVDKGEVLFETKEDKISEYKYYDNGSDIVIGTEHTEFSKKCIYKEVTNTVYNNYGKIEKDGSEFLVLECNNLTKTTYSIDREYRELEDIDGKAHYTESKSLTYYEKDIGYFAHYIVDKATIKPCRSECQYQDEQYYNYTTSSIVYD